MTFFSAFTRRLAASRLARPVLAGCFLTGSLLAGSLLAGCTPAPSRAPDIYYDMSLTPVEQNYGSTASLSISSVSAQGVMSGRPFVIRASSDPLSYTELRGHLWHIPPAQLLQSALVESLSAGSSDLIIGTSETITSPDFRLKLKVQQFSFRPGIDAALSLSAIITSKSGEVIYSGTVAAEYPVSGEAPSDAVRAYQNALQDISAQLAETLSSSL